MNIVDFFEITDNDMFLFAGPCVLESDEINDKIAGELKKACDSLGIKYVFKASFDKANRSSIASCRGPGIEEGLKELKRISQKFGVPTVTDIHESYQAYIAAQYVDILQIPAFLARQTDLLVAAAKTGKPINVKKPQFMSGEDMKNVVAKLRESGARDIMLTERGTMFGYNNLVVDYRNMLDMAEFGLPLIMDATHSTQRPGGEGSKSGGDPKYAPYLAKCAAICNVKGFFFEVHPNPKEALSDASTMMSLDGFLEFLPNLKQCVELASGFGQK